MGIEDLNTQAWLFLKISSNKKNMWPDFAFECCEVTRKQNSATPSYAKSVNVSRIDMHDFMKHRPEIYFINYHLLFNWIIKPEEFCRFIVPI